MTRLLILFVAATFLSGCYTDSCTDMRSRRASSPSRTRYASVFVGPCPGAAPQVLIGFDRGQGGAGVFALADSASALDVEWLSEDTLQITYPRSARVIKQEPSARFNLETVVVVDRQADTVGR